MAAGGYFEICITVTIPPGFQTSTLEGIIIPKIKHD